MADVKRGASITIQDGKIVGMTGAKGRMLIAPGGEVRVELPDGKVLDRLRVGVTWKDGRPMFERGPDDDSVVF